MIRVGEPNPHFIEKRLDGSVPLCYNVIMENNETNSLPKCEDCGDSGMVWVGGGQREPSEDFCVCEIGHSMSDDFYTEEPCEDDSWADSDALASAGMGTDEDYGCYDSGDWY
jgi:hypothetical protein